MVAALEAMAYLGSLALGSWKVEGKAGEEEKEECIHPPRKSLLVRLIGREGFSDAGSHPSPPAVRGISRLYLAAYCVPHALLVLGLALSLLLGILPNYLQATHTSPAVFGMTCLND